MSSTWNYRVMRTVSGEETTYGVHEVFYDESGTVIFWTQEPVSPIGDTVEELQTELKRMIEATWKPMLDAEDGSEL